MKNKCVKCQEHQLVSIVLDTKTAEAGGLLSQPQQHSKTWYQLTDIYRTLHPSTKEYIFYLATQRTFSKIELTLGYKEKPQQIQEN